MRVAVFGLGKFGRQVAVELGQAGHDVLAVDEKEDLVQAVRDHVSEAVAGNATDRQTLQSLGLERADAGAATPPAGLIFKRGGVVRAAAAVVSLGVNMAGSILLTMYLKELQVDRVMVKALNDDHAAVLIKVGADEIVFPEREMARKLAYSLTHPSVAEFLPLGADQAIVELETPSMLANKSLKELDLRRRHGVQVLAIKSLKSDAVTAAIDPDLVIPAGSTLIVLGRNEDIEKLRTAS